MNSFEEEKEERIGLKRRTNEPAAARSLVLFWGVGGAGTRLAQRIAEDLVASFGRDNVAMSVHESNPWLDRALLSCGNVHTISGAGGRLNLLSLATSTLSRLAQLLRFYTSFKPDVLVIPMNFAQALPAALLMRVFRCAVVYVVHDAVPHPGDYMPRMQKITQLLLVGIATRIVCMSRYVASCMLSFGGKRTSIRLHVIALASHVPRLQTEPRTLLPGPVRFLFLGRLLDYKGLDILAAAIALIADRTDWRLTIAGNGSQREAVRNLFKDYHQVDLAHLKWLLEGEVDLLLESHNVIVCPYIEASQSGVVAEAAAHGLPSIVTPVGGLPEQIGAGSSGWLCADTSPLEIAKAMAEVLDNRGAYTARSAAALGTTYSEPGHIGWDKIIANAIKK